VPASPSAYCKRVTVLVRFPSPTGGISRMLADPLFLRFLWQVETDVLLLTGLLGLARG